MTQQNDYWLLLARIRRGIRPNTAEFSRACVLAGKSPEDVLLDLTDPEGPWEATWNGDRCDHCNGAIRIVATRQTAEWKIKRLGCATCGKRFPDLILRRNVLPGKSLQVNAVGNRDSLLERPGTSPGDRH